MLLLGGSKYLLLGSTQVIYLNYLRGRPSKSSEYGLFHDFPPNINN
jgi:hypothetical protein